MAYHRHIRLYVPERLQAGITLPLSESQTHYVKHVMRVPLEATCYVFNAEYGEWQASLLSYGKKEAILSLQHCIRPTQDDTCNLWLCFAPVKNVALHSLVEKAVELGVNRLLPVRTAYTVVKEVRIDKMHAQAVEAAEQCERLSIPEINAYQPLSHLLKSWPEGRVLFYCDETRTDTPLNLAIHSYHKSHPCAALIGPEGGFSMEEKQYIKSFPFTVPVTLGPRILRADTAAIAALSIIASTLGDW